jgi:hypothetical protein
MFTSRTGGEKWSWTDAKGSASWLAERGLIQCPQLGALEEDTKTPEENEPEAAVTEDAPSKRKATVVRRIPFTIENPKSMLHRRKKFKESYKRYLTFTPLCRWGEAYQKETCLWTPFGRKHFVCAGRCHHFPHGPPTGSVNHPYTIGGQTSRALRGPGEITHRNRIPARLLRWLLTNARLGKKRWFLDLCSGYQTNRAVVELHGLIYVAVDIEKIFKLGSGPSARLAVASLVADLGLTNPEDLLSQIHRELDHAPEDLAFIWFSPPCETHADMQNVNRARDSAETPVRWHRDREGTPRPGPKGGLARKHDAMTNKWTKWITQQWGQSPRGLAAEDPKATPVMPDEGIKIVIEHEMDGRISPYQSYPQPPAQKPRRQPRQASRGKNSLGLQYLPSDEKRTKWPRPGRKGAGTTPQGKQAGSEQPPRSPPSRPWTTKHG